MNDISNTIQKKKEWTWKRACIQFLTCGGVITCCAILLIEYFLTPALSQKYISHEVDFTIRMLNSSSFRQPVVVLGDSVGHRIFAYWDELKNDVVTLACNQATEAAGQYFFLMRFIKKNQPPKAIIICDRGPLYGNLEQVLTENYVQRVFTEWPEILDLFSATHNPAFALKMIFYKLLGTYKYRLHLQKELTGFTNSDIYSGSAPGKKAKKNKHGAIYLLKKAQRKQRTESIATHYFEKILTTAQENNIELYYLPPPTSTKGKQSQKMVNSSLQRLRQYEQDFDHFHILSPHYAQYPARLFPDSVHPNQEGLKLIHAVLEPEVKNIIKKAYQ